MYSVPRTPKLMDAENQSLNPRTTFPALRAADGCASLNDNSAFGANPPKSERQIIAEAQRDRLKHELRTLASWCASRAMLEYDTETTLTMLEKKASELRAKVMKAGWAAIAEHSQHAKSDGTDASEKTL